MKNKNRAPLPRLKPGLHAVDTHCHLEMDAYDEDRDTVIRNAVGDGVSRIITIGIDVETSRRAQEIAGQHEGVFATVGVHPHNVSAVTEDDYATLCTLAGHPKVVAYGEIGLDFVKWYAPEAEQRYHFQRQVELGKSLGLPLIIHDREAHAATMETLKGAAPFPAGGVMHCFSGNMALAEEVLSLGFHISIPGVVTFGKAHDLQEVAAKVPLSSLLLETDGPYLAPEPWRGRRNIPSHVLYTAAKIASLRAISLEEVAARTSENAARLFRLPTVPEP